MFTPARSSSRAYIVGLAVHLVGAVLAEQHDELAEQRRYLGLGVLARSRTVLTTADPEEATHLPVAGALSA